MDVVQSASFEVIQEDNALHDGRHGLALSKEISV